MKAINRLISQDKFKNFPVVLRQLREKKGFTRKQFGIAIGKNYSQVQRYEAIRGQKALPSLETFSQICLILQVDPVELLALEWVDAQNTPEPGVIYDWHIGEQSDLTNDFFKFHWQCPNNFCQHRNIEYDAYRLEKFVRQQFMCEECDGLFYKLYKVDFNKKKKK